MRSGCHHMGHSPEAQAKSAFVIGGPHGAKYEFKVSPFGLAQALAYFQCFERITICFWIA